MGVARLVRADFTHRRPARPARALLVHRSRAPPGAGTPETVRFATVPRPARETIAAALDAGVEAPWVTGDEAYGQDPWLHAALGARGTGCVLAVACSTGVRINHGRTPSVRSPSPAACPPPPGSGREQPRSDPVGRPGDTPSARRGPRPTGPDRARGSCTGPPGADAARHQPDTATTDDAPPTNLPDGR
ncbi:transposase [Streptomyces sp. NPDC086122]|uniref:transposase n=1 Tax=Streptomyces sp. NPDC086122 TaxID=3155294 RepID=UPI0034196DDC